MATEQNTPICRSCKWHQAGDRCGHPTSRQAPEIDPVDGRVRTPGGPALCWMVRTLNYERVCGPRGKYWEAAT